MVSEEGITNKILEARRVSSYFVPIAKPKEGFGRRHGQTGPDCFVQTVRLDENLPAFVRVGQRLKIGEF